MSSNTALQAVLKIQVNKRKKAVENIVVVEAFKERYIKVVDSNENSYHLEWNPTLSLYSGSFLDSTFTCQYDVQTNFTAEKIAANAKMPAEVARRRKSGRPVSMQ